ncbi:MAG: circularly permuted type 2 ATP-grasp protein [Cellulomonas sp.]|nr:circularly permuted type 2 ATP-grasp protein [Cellulomonas sp.]
MTDLLSSPVPGTGGTGALRPDWSWLPDGQEPSDHSLTAARERVDTVLGDHGVTYGGTDERWRLDPEPVIVHAAQWTGLDAGLVQRAELLDAVLHDLYGPRRLLTDALLPPTAVLSHPGFERAVDGLALPGGRDLVLTATDVVRDGEGRWCAIADRTQAPSGAGYAMEDRRVVAQVLAGVYRQASIARLGPFFHALRLALQEAAPPGPGEPRAVLLTSGPASETAFDQAYLASMLGLPLVEGADLLVREGRVWMRGLEGLEPVDVVLRRVDAAWCDPLELYSGSRLGTPGLVRAVRAGTVAVVNPLGSSVLESPAVLAHLPQLARAVLGGDLLLDSAPTWWCGDELSRRHVLAHLDRLVLLPTEAGPEPTTILGWTLTTAGRAELAARIEARPWAWCGQEPAGQLEPSSPVGPHAAVLRTYAVAHDASYTVMAGGLARVSDAPVVSSALGARAKDVWVLASPSHPVAARAGWEDDDTFAEAGAGRGPATGISPRTAENLYWMGRYAERAENQARVLRAVIDRWDDYHGRGDSAGGKALDVLLHALELRDDDEPAPARLPTLRDLVLDQEMPRSVARSVLRLTSAAQAARDQLSTDTFGPIARMERALRDERGRARPARHAQPTLAEAAASPRPEVRDGSPSQAIEALGREGISATSGLRPVLERVLESLLAVSGIAAEGLTRDVGWRFLDAGRRIERAQHVLDTLSATTVRAGAVEVDELVLESLLLTHESAITYRRRFQAAPQVTGVLDLLVHDRTNPRSLAYSLDRLLVDLEAVPFSSRPPDQRDHLLRDVTDLEAELDSVAAGSVVGADGRRVRLAESLDSMRWRLRAAHVEIEAVHFARPAPLRTQTDLWGSPNAAEVAE